jgi:cyanate permease
MAGVSVGSLACNGVPANFTSMFVDRGHSLEVASTALIAYGVGSMLAKFAWGTVANRFHIRGVLLALVALGIVSMPSLLALPGQAGATVLGYGFLVGFFVGAYVPLHQLVWASYFGRAHVGAISGIGRPLGVFFISAGPFMMAALHDVSGNYDSGLLVTTAALVVCALCIYLARPPLRRTAVVLAEAG